MTTPLAIVGGFLGAGKTSLVNHVLREAHGVRFAVLVNDFGEIALDDRLVVDHGGDTVSFANGCLCCTLGDDLLDTVDRILALPRRPDQFLVEASGVADPMAIADIATLHPDLSRDLVIVLCDAATVRTRAGDARLSDTVERQIRAADLLVLNHCDRVTSDSADEVRAWLVDRASRPVVTAEHGRIDIELLRATPTAEPHAPTPGGAPHPFHARVVRGRAPVPIERLRERLRALGAPVLRVKGLLRDGADPNVWWIVQRVGERVEIRPAPAPNSAPAESALVVLSAEPLARAGDLAARLGLQPST